MDIRECANKDLSEVELFISEHFDRVSKTYLNPVFPHYAKLKNRSELLFCGIKVDHVWVFKENEHVMFFLIIPRELPMLQAITGALGPHESETTGSINNSDDFVAYYWTINKYSASLQSYRNIWDLKEFDDCLLVRFGNTPSFIMDSYNESFEVE